MKRKKTSKAAAMTASANARAAVGAHEKQDAKTNNDDAAQPRSSSVRTTLAVLCICLIIKLIISSSKQRLPSAANFTRSEITNLSLLPDSINNLTTVATTAFDEFYAANVQPLVDAGRSAFNGTLHESEETNRVGYQLREQNARAKHPVVMIPGFVTTGLELWQGLPCAKQHFRQRLWGSASMAREFIIDMLNYH